jgi:hypothetical protein
MVPVTMTARITSTWRSVIICRKLQIPCPVRHQRGPPAFGIFSNQKKRNREVDPSNTEIVVFYIDHNPLSANDASLAWKSPRGNRGLVLVHIDLAGLSVQD